jgi:SAM-dependent methyltransferase
MSHVLEHLPAPLEVVQLLLERVRPGGHLILGVPNPVTPVGFAAALLRRQLVNPTHLQTWDRGHWAIFLENAVGAKVVEYAGDEVRVFPGGLKRLRPVQGVQILLGRVAPWLTFTLFAVIRRPTGNH